MMRTALFLFSKGIHNKLHRLDAMELYRSLTGIGSLHLPSLCSLRLNGKSVERLSLTEKEYVLCEIQQEPEKQFCIIPGAELIVRNGTARENLARLKEAEEAAKNKPTLVVSSGDRAA